MDGQTYDKPKTRAALQALTIDKALPESKLFDTLIAFLKEYLKKNMFDKKSAINEQNIMKKMPWVQAPWGFFMLFCRLLIFFKTNFFEKLFQE